MPEEPLVRRVPTVLTELLLAYVLTVILEVFLFRLGEGLAARRLHRLRLATAVQAQVTLALVVRPVLPALAAHLVHGLMV